MSRHTPDESREIHHFETINRQLEDKCWAGLFSTTPHRPRSGVFFFERMEPLRRPSYKIGLKLMKPTSIVKFRPRHAGDHQTAIRRIRQLSAPQVVTGRERRRIDPN